MHHQVPPPRKGIKTRTKTTPTASLSANKWRKTFEESGGFFPIIYSSYHSQKGSEKRVFLTLNDDDDDDDDDESLVVFVFFFFAEEQEPSRRKKSRRLVEENSFENVF